MGIRDPVWERWVVSGEAGPRLTVATPCLCAGALERGVPDVVRPLPGLSLGWSCSRPFPAPSTPLSRTRVLPRFSGSHSEPGGLLSPTLWGSASPCCRPQPCCPASGTEFLSAGARSPPLVLGASLHHEMIMLRGYFSSVSAVQSVPKVSGDNGPENRSEGQNSSSLQRSAFPSGKATSCRLASSLTVTTTFLWTPRKAIFSLQNTDRKNFLPPEPARW